MSLREINFDGIIGPSHNYAGLSLGNLASTRNAGDVSRPRAAALQGIDKMRANLALGLSQGIFVPHRRPDRLWLAELGTSIEDAGPGLAANAMSASAMWAANAATVSPAPDTGDGKCHLTVANLRTMPHRSHEWPATLAQLKLAFAGSDFSVHGPVPPAFGDEGAANHMRLAAAHGEPGIEVFVYGVSGGAFPARQHIEASGAVARLHRLDPERVIFAEQSEQAIAAGAFHNDVVAVANERVLFAHEQAFADKDTLIAALEASVAGFEYVEVPASEVPLTDAVRSYLFNAQLVTPPDGQPTLIVPNEARENSLGLELDRTACLRQRTDPPRGSDRRPPVHGEWRRSGMPSAARRRRPHVYRPSFHRRRNETRHNRRHRAPLVAGRNPSRRLATAGAGRGYRARPRRAAQGARPYRSRLTGLSQKQDSGKFHFNTIH